MTSVDLSRPDGMLPQDDYAPPATGSGSRLLVLAGQIATGPDGRLEADDLAAQVFASLEYVARSVEGGGGTVADIPLLTPEILVEIEAIAVVD